MWGSTGVEERLDRLESLVEQQQETIQQQRERITELEGETDSDETPLLANRRTALKAGGLAALLFGGVGTASADPQGQVGTSSHPLKKLYTEELNGGITGDTALTDMTGTGLQIASGSLDIDSNGVGSKELASDSVTVAGNTVSLGATTPVDYVDLADTGNSFPIPNSDLANDSVTIAGNEVALGGSTTLAISHTALSDVNPGNHHTRPSAGDGLTETDNTFSVTLSKVGSESGTGVLAGVGTDDIEYRSITSEDSVTVSQNSGTVTVGVTTSNSNVTSSFPDSIVSTSGEATVTNGAITLASTPDTSGEATVEWSRPESVSQWGTVAFEAEQNGEQLDVYVQTRSNDGNTWSDWDVDGDGSAEPIAPGTDLSSIPPDDHVRFRVSLATSSSSKPRLSTLVRQWRT